jgi:hypothetical protein
MKLFLTLLMILPSCSKPNDYFVPFIPVSQIDRELSRKHHYKYELNFYTYSRAQYICETLTFEGELDIIDAWDRFVESGDDIFKWDRFYIIPKNYHYVTLKAI